MDAHKPEYLAAVAGMAETYGTTACREADTFAIGDHISFRLTGWSPRSYDDGRVIDHIGCRLIVETASDVVEVDPRPWPEGHVLPF